MPRDFLFSPHPPLWGEGQVLTHYWWGLGWRCQIRITPGSVHSFPVSLTPPWWSSAHPPGGGAPESSHCPLLSQSSICPIPREWDAHREGFMWQRGRHWPEGCHYPLASGSRKPGQGTQYLGLPLSFSSPSTSHR